MEFWRFLFLYRTIRDSSRNHFSPEDIGKQIFENRITLFAYERKKCDVK